VALSISKHLSYTGTVQPALSVYDVFLPIAYSSSTTFKKEAVSFSEMSGTNYQLTQCCMPKDCNLPYFQPASFSKTVYVNGEKYMPQSS
jgi:hypothetical protein